jgi:hypothetical protein
MMVKSPKVGLVCAVCLFGQQNSKFAAITVQSPKARWANLDRYLQAWYPDLRPTIK